MKVDVDVFVAGAGPSGLCLAADLVRRGIAVRVVDRKAGPEPFWKAGNLWPRTQELLSGLPGGLMATMRSRSLALDTVHVHAHGRRLTSIPGNRYDESPFNAALLNGQNIIESTLAEHLAQAGTPVDYATTVTRVSGFADHVEVVCARKDGGQETIRARYVAGCDGGRSVVREAAGLDFEPTAQRGVEMLIADVRLTWSRPTRSDQMWIFLYGNGYAGVAPQSGGSHHIWFFDAVEVPTDRDPTAEEIEARLREVAGDPSVTVTEGLWFSHIGNPRTGVAPGLRRDRMFLVGDAGHVALPVGGQGMNSGMQDAFNLGWKLAAAVKGEAGELLLDSYEAERLPVRRALMQDQVAGMERMLHPNWLDKLGMRVVAPFLARTGGATEFAGQRDAAMLDIAYPESALSVDDLRGGGVDAGDRAPDAIVARLGGEDLRLHNAFHGDGRWTLLTFDGGTETSAAQDLAVSLAGPTVQSLAILSHVADSKSSPDAPYCHDLDRSAHLAFGVEGRPTVFLIRPDGHIAYRGRLELGDRVRSFLLRIQVS